MPLLLFVLAVVCAVLGLYALAVVGVGLYFGVVHNLKAPLVKRPAQVVKKEARQIVVLTLFAGVPHTTFTVTFAFPDSRHKCLSVNESQYQRLQEGSQGLLCSQGLWYKGFEVPPSA